MATHSSILAWNPYGQRSLVDCSPWGCKESDTIELPALSLSHSQYLMEALYSENLLLFVLLIVVACG